MEAEVSGDCTVIIMNEIGCVDTSNCISVISTGNDNAVVRDKFQVSPNPARSEIALFSQEGFVPNVVFLNDQRGNLVMNISIDDFNAIYPVEFTFLSSNKMEKQSWNV